MAQDLTADALRPHFAANTDLIRDALAAIYAGDARQLSLDAIESSAAMLSRDAVGLLVESLRTHGTSQQFVAFMQGRGVPLVRLGVVNGGLDHQKMARFAAESWAFRCRIRVNGRVMGSGALVSARLVLTAAHVVQAALDAAQNGSPAKIEVLAADGQNYPARCIFALPCHPDEHSGALPPLDEADAHLDVALLRIDPPLGRRYNHVQLPDIPANWIGPADFVLVHFPEGQDAGFLTGKITRDSSSAIRLPHNISAAPGSSGGAGFNNDFTFLGIHQGKFQGPNGNTRRIVPYDRFAANADFQAALNRDKPPRRLWSLDGTLDSHLIIGRGLFFDGLSAMIEGDARLLRGIWVRRMDVSVTTGLGFSHDILDGFLRAHRQPHRIYRIPMSLGVADLAKHIRNIVEDDSQPGIGDDAPIDQLVRRLDEQSKAAGRMTWLYVDNPPAGLLAQTQVQLEQFVQAVLTRPNLRIVIAGYETIGLVNALSETVDSARRASRPNLLVETLGHFTRQDIEGAIKQMAHALDLEWDRAVIAHVAALAVKDLTPTFAGHFNPEDFVKVSNFIRDHARLAVGS